MTKTMLLYKNIQALSRDEHKNLKVKAVDNLAFASQLHWAPIAGSEFYPIARNYPIVFIKTDPANSDSPIVPIALVGLEAESNEFIDAENNWESSIYIPAFVRRYPFVLANASSKEDEFAVCFDRDYKGFNEVEGDALFNPDGTNSLFLTEIIQFMDSFRAEMQRTNEFVKLLEKYQLLKVKSADITSSTGETFSVQDFLVVDDEKFEEVAAYKINDLHKNGFLGWVFAHFISLGNLPPLFDRYLARRAKTTEKKTKK